MVKFSGDSSDEGAQYFTAQNMLQRISYVLAIYKALQILLPNEQAADRWIKEPNLSPLFAGKAPLDLVLADQVSGLRVVRQYLDAQLNG